MIGKLTGIIDSIAGDYCIVNVGGVGYIVYCSSRMLLRLEQQKTYNFVIHMLVKEDQLTLFGFENEQEKSCFLSLQTVQGVGAKMALGILNAMNPSQISLALTAEDSNAFKQVSGIGSKLASRIVNELKNKAYSIFGLNPAPALVNTAVGKADESLLMDAISALSNLGFSKSEAFPIISKICAENENISLSDLIRESLSKIKS